MGLIVQKYGGSSVADAQKIRGVARRVIRMARSGHGVVVVVSAMGKTTFTKLKTTVTKHLGRSYVWGATGTKSFDCSGFLGRVMLENGIPTKRTTARKFYMLLPKATPEDHTKFGTVIFFDNLKHVGIVDTGSSFYHAQVSRGTNLSPLNSFWRRRIYGYRAMPVLP